MLAYAYESTGHTLVPIEIQQGDEVLWKGQGYYSALRAEIVGWRDETNRVRIRLLDHDDQTRLVKPRFLSVSRNGKRLP